MELFEAIVNRRSVRKYKPKELEWFKIAQIIEAATFAPSSGNVQDWRFIVVRDRGAIENIAKACFGQHWMETAPVLVVVCSDIRNLKRLYDQRGTDFYSIQNCAAAIQNMLLAAESLEIGSCWVGSFDDNSISDSLGLADFIKPQAIITLGYSDEKPKQPLKTALEHVVYFEAWGAQSGTKIEPSELLKLVKDYGTLNEIRFNKMKNNLSAQKNIFQEKFKKLGKILSDKKLKIVDLFKK